MNWWQQLLLTGVGVLLGGAISTASTLHMARQQWQNERKKRLDDQGRIAALELIKLLVEIRDAHLAKHREPAKKVTKLEAMEGAQQEQAKSDTLEMHAQCIGEEGLRKQILEFNEKRYWLDREHRLAVNHLRDCCGAFLRYQNLPPEPQDLREMYNWIDEDHETQAQMQEEFRLEERRKAAAEEKPTDKGAAQQSP